MPWAGRAAGRVPSRPPYCPASGARPRAPAVCRKGFRSPAMASARSQSTQVRRWYLLAIASRCFAVIFMDLGNLVPHRLAGPPVQHPPGQARSGEELDAGALEPGALLDSPRSAAPCWAGCRPFGHAPRSACCCTFRYRAYKAVVSMRQGSGFLA
jgi:hypothetical protein